MKLGEMKISDIDEKQLIRGFIFTAREGLATPDEIQKNLDIVTNHIDQLNGLIAELQDAADQFQRACEAQDSQTSIRLVEEYGSEENIQRRYSECVKERDSWAHLMNQLEELQAGNKVFNKSLCFANIRELLRKNPDVKIGQIEKAAGIRLGYMSRLEKDGNTAEPSIEFIMTAAKMLKVSLDTLVTVDLTGLTPTEQYIISFFDKLKTDTLADKLDWSRETVFNLNRIEPDYNGFVYHPLFAEETFYEESECEYPNEVTRIVFTSKTFGPRTHIAGDCFNLRLKNGTTLYLMDIEKSVHKINDPLAFAKEAWIHVPTKGSSLLVASQDDSPVAALLEPLFATVKARMEHPKINKDIKYAIDSFMNDDVGDDDEEIPF